MTPQRLFQILVFLGIVAVVMAAVAHAKDKEYVLRGVFCNQEQDIIDVYADLRGGLSVEDSMVVRNKDKVTCVYATSIKYVVTQPAIIGQVGAFGMKFERFRGTLVGIVIAGETKYVDPLTIYFARLPGDLEGVEERGA